jgi:hypothetical protein
MEDWSKAEDQRQAEYKQAQAQHEAKPKEEKVLPPPTPAIGEKISTEYFQYIKKERHWQCQEAIIRHAEYGIRAPGLLYGTNYNDDVYLRFTRMSPIVNGDGNKLLAGDEAEAQNAAGTWVGVKYTCTVNVNTLEVRDVFSARGRFTN